MDMFDDQNPYGAGPAGLFAQLAQFGGGMGYRMGRPSARGFDEYYRAYSVAMLPGKQRENVSYGGKIIMPPSALASLSSMELETPAWMFKLQNATNPAASTHAGVLEFIAEEGCVNLPHWMMKTLRLEEGDPVRLTSAQLQKGKFVKLQAQSTVFLEISDPKAVLEQALRHFTALTQGDIIEISYNSIVFGLLVMETQPGGEGISVLDTDLEVDFAAPVGYVEPERPKATASSMASKLNIDLSSHTPGSSRPSSSLGGTIPGTSTRGTAVSKGGEHWESFKGKGETLAGRKTKGKGISHRNIEAAPQDSKIIRTDKQHIVTSENLESDASVPAPLNLPFGQLFFGFNIPPYVPSESKTSSEQPHTFAGSGSSLNGRPLSQAQPSPATAKGKEKENAESAPTWGSGGQTLSSRPSVPPSRTGSRALGAGGARVPVLPVRNKSKQKQKERSPSPEWDVDEDDIIEIDSD